MLKRKKNILDKIVKKDYNNQLEMLLEKKTFGKDTKNILLSILYKIEISYKDYKQVKQNVEAKDEMIGKFLKNIENNCSEIKLIKPNSPESDILNGKSFLVEKKGKIIFCYPIERKVLYCISKISQKDKVISDKNFVIDETLSDLLVVGKNINTVEVLRDFNGYSWTTISREIESADHNLIYQDLILLVGNKFLDKWLDNQEIMLDYMEMFITKMEETYNEELAKEFIENLKKISILLKMKYDKENIKKIQKLKRDIDHKVEEISDNQAFLEKLTKEKMELTKEIRNIDETINNKKMLQEEYARRNEKLPITKKIFSARILSKLMEEEREEKIARIEELNELINPKKFVKYKKELKAKQEVLKILDTEDVEGSIDKLKLQMQKIFLQCFEQRIEKAETKQEILKLIYEFRYYTMLPYDYERTIREIQELQETIENMEKILIKKAHNVRIIEKLSKQEDVDYELLKHIFSTRIINLVEIYIKLKKEKERFFIQVFDGESIEDKIEIQDSERIKKKDLYIILNKKVKVFC